MSSKVIDTQGVWKKIRVDVSEVEEYDHKSIKQSITGVDISRDNLIEKADAFKRSIIKFGAFSAQLESDSEISTMLVPAGQELTNAFAVLCGFMAAIALEGGKYLALEVANLGDDIDKLVDKLNTEALTNRAGVSRVCGALLDRVQRVKKMSIDPASASRKVVIGNIKCVKDAKAELEESLQRAKDKKEAGEEEEVEDVVCEDLDDDLLFEGGDDDLYLLESAAELEAALGDVIEELKSLAVSAADDILAERSGKLASKIDELVLAITTGSDDEEEFDDIFEELEREGWRFGHVREIVRREMISLG